VEPLWPVAFTKTVIGTPPLMPNPKCCEKAVAEKSKSRAMDFIKPVTPEV
jgi:hypothetical protein